MPNPAGMVYRTWGKHGGYWTLDINSGRLIVKALLTRKQVMGASRIYKAWSGSILDSNQRPVAFITARREYNCTNELRRRTEAMQHSKGLIDSRRSKHKSRSREDVQTEDSENEPG